MTEDQEPIKVATSLHGVLAAEGRVAFGDDLRGHRTPGGGDHNGRQQEDRFAVTYHGGRML